MENDDSTLDNTLDYKITPSGLNFNHQIYNKTVGSAGSGYYSGNVTISSNGSSVISGSPYIYTTNTTNPAGLHVSGDSEFEGDIKVKGHSLLHLMKKMEERLAILQEPDPAKLEKFAALKKAYEHYKTLERLIGED